MYVLLQMEEWEYYLEQNIAVVVIVIVVVIVAGIAVVGLLYRFQVSESVLL